MLYSGQWDSTLEAVEIEKGPKKEVKNGAEIESS